MASSIIFDNVSKVYLHGKQEFLALAKTSFSIASGEFCTIIGPSGCGKSTLINLVAGFIRPTSGQVLIDGKSCGQPNSKRVVVAQNYNLFPWKTALGNVEFGLKAKGVSKGERIGLAMHYLELLKISAFFNSYPNQLSGGMQQRLALARALAVRPNCLLLDEPLAALDVMLRHQIQEELLNIWTNENQTVILITHDLDEAIYLSDRIIVLSSFPGRIFYEISIPFSRPRHSSLRFSTDFQILKREITSIILD